ncbi:MAG: trypsin-like peptidase domain-containing protein [Nocardioides sp.]
MTEQDDHPTAAPAADPPAAGSETTQPLSAWVPPSGGDWPAYPPPGTQALASASADTGRPAAGRAKLSGWVWPVVAATALVVGVIGGVGGSVAYEQLGDDAADNSGTVSEGLGGVDVVTLPPLASDGGSVSAVAEELLPSTVQISAEFEGEEGGATGSGFVLDKQGHIVTNNHVVEDAAENAGPIEIVDQEGNRYDATVVGRSPVYDLAILYAKDAKDLKPAALGASETLRIGDGVVALGSPLGLSSTVTAGIVSSLNRPVTTGDSADESSYINAVQTDAAINPGNSGGPLVNLRGQVVGVNSAIATNGGGTFSGEAGNIGVGFAIPVEQVITTADQILRTGEASYPVIGARVQTGGSDDVGATIERVLPDTPAEEAGLEEGDRVVAVDGERVIDGISLIVLIRTNQPGDQLEFTYLRGGDERTTEITLGAETG